MICKVCAIITIEKETVIVISFHVFSARREAGNGRIEQWKLVRFIP